MAQPKVSIIVLNYNRRDDTLDCLRSLSHLTYLNVQVIVVDNGSTDGTVEVVRTAFPAVEVLGIGQNLGFTGGNNLGIRYALAGGAEYIMLLNNDTIVAPDMLDVLVKAMSADPAIGVAGPTIYYYSQPETIWSAGGNIDWKHGLTNMIGIGDEDKGQFGTAPRGVDFVTGCALLVRRDVWEKAGLLDDKFFMYYEETEWCVRAQRAGFRIIHVPMAMMWHKISLAEREASERVYYYMTRNRLLFLRNTGASLRTWLYTFGEYGRTFMSWTLRPKWQDRRHLRSVMLRAVRDFSMGSFGQKMV